MREDLELSIDTAITFQKLMETFRDIVRQQVRGKPLNDELSYLMLTAHNGLGNMLVNLFANMEQLTERKSVFGKEGLEKQILVTFEDNEEETPDEEADYYEPDEEEPDAD